MTIRNKLTLQLSGIFIFILLTFCLVVFLFTKKIVEQDFYENLKARALITATIYLEADEISEEELRKYKKRFLQSLDKEITKVYNLDHEQVFYETQDTLSFSKNTLETIEEEGKLYFRRDKRQFSGIFYEDNQGDFIIVASAIDEAGIRKLEGLTQVLIITFIISVIIIVFASNLFAKQALRPIAAIINEVNDIQPNKLFARLNTSREKDEITLLAETFNRLLDRLEEAFQMQKNFVSNASHELRTPITGISAEIELALMKPRDAQTYEKSLRSVQEEVDKLSELTESIIHLAQTSFDISKINLAFFRLDELLLIAQDWCKKHYPNRKINLNIKNIHKEKDLLYYGNQQLLGIAVKNIVDNALKFSSGNITISLTKMEQQWEICVDDLGPGIPQEEHDKIFQTFYRSNKTRNIPGYGIGLSITDKIVKIHQGNIRLQNRKSGGLRVAIVLKAQMEKAETN